MIRNLSLYIELMTLCKSSSFRRALPKSTCKWKFIKANEISTVSYIQLHFPASRRKEAFIKNIWCINASAAYFILLQLSQKVHPFEKSPNFDCSADFRISFFLQVDEVIFQSMADLVGLIGSKIRKIIFC